MSFDYSRMAIVHAIKCYDGAYDSKTSACFAAQNECLALIRVKEPEATVTYFPAEGKYVVHVWGRELSHYRYTKAAALQDAHQKLYPEELV